MKKSIPVIIIISVLTITITGIALHTTQSKNSTTEATYSANKRLPQEEEAPPLPTNKPPSEQDNTSSYQEPVITKSLSTTRQGWGIKRNNNHQQPEVPSQITKTLARYDAYWIGNTREKAVYLTFDEGYENGYTPGILDVLKKYNVKAAFFITGHYLKSQPELVKRMVDEGHIVGNHTVNHYSLPDLSTEQIKEEVLNLEKEFTRLTGKRMCYLRPPKGEYSERTLAETRALGYHNIFWSLAMVDWVPMPGGPDEAYQSVMNNLHNGAIILLHAVSKDNARALDKILKDIKAQGYTLKTLDELVTEQT